MPSLLGRWLKPPFARARPPRIAVVGCGVSGAAAAIALCERWSGPLDLVLADVSGRFGPGFAHGRSAGEALLNVRARDLSIRPAMADDFVTWFRTARDGTTDASKIAEAFLPRADYGDYVEQRLRDAIAARPDVTAIRIPDEAMAVSARPGGLEIVFRTQGEMVVDALFLTTGYGMLEPSRRRYGLDPFGRFDPEAVRAAESVLFVGSGLTMVDCLLALRRSGFAGRATALSRRGLPPRSHATRHVAVPPLDLNDIGSIAGILRHIREASRLASEYREDWQGVINALRRQMQDIWTSFTVHDRLRFLDHIAPYWENVRHRLPPEMFARVAAELDAGGLRIVAGRVLQVRQGRHDVEAQWRGPGGQRISHRFDLVFDCTGYLPATETPLIGSLLAQGLVMRDPLRMGIAVHRSGRARGSRRDGGAPIFALGPLGRGSLYEITAVPEIVAQAAQAVETLARASLRGEATRLRPRLPWDEASFG